MSSPTQCFNSLKHSLIRDIVKDHTSVNLHELADESDERLAFFELALSFIPTEMLEDVALAIHVRFSEQEDLYTSLSAADMERLKNINNV